jgi:hypothetical protein
MKTAPVGTFPGAAAGKCLFALTRQPLHRSGRPEAAAPDSCTRVASTAGVWSYIQGKPPPGREQSYFRHIPSPGARAGRVDTTRRKVLTSWLPRSCGWSCMNAAAMSFGRAGGAAGEGTSGHGSAGAPEVRRGPGWWQAVGAAGAAVGARGPVGARRSGWWAPGGGEFAINGTSPGKTE